ncbi:MAG: hypothetical protein ACU85V_20555, partial [Gammaproteobacteria bacterium]
LGAAVLAVGIGALARVLAVDLVVDPASVPAALGMLGGLVALTLVGIHPVISVATLSGLFPPALSRPDLVAVVVLMAWTASLGTSPFSGTALAMQGRFGIRATEFLRWNFDYTLAALAAGSAILAAAAYWGLI